MPNINSVKVNGIDYDVNDNRLVDASTTDKGIVQLATLEQILEGTNNTVVTAKMLKSLIDNKILSSGGNSGMLIADFKNKVGITTSGYITPTDGFIAAVTNAGTNNIAAVYVEGVRIAFGSGGSNTIAYETVESNLVGVKAGVTVTFGGSVNVTFLPAIEMRI